MQDVVYGHERGYLLSVPKLRTAAAVVSSQSTIWWVYDPHLTPSRQRIFLGVADSSNLRLLNDIVLSGPIVERGLASDPDEGIIVELCGETIDVEVPGLYLESGGLEEDTISDFTIFWNRLSEELDACCAETISRLCEGMSIPGSQTQSIASQFNFRSSCDSSLGI